MTVNAFQEDIRKSKLVRLTERGKVRAKETGGRLFEAERAAFLQWSEEELRLYLEPIKKQDATLREKIEML